MGEVTKKGEPLTLEGLATYTNEVLLPAMSEQFATKEDLKKEIAGVKQEVADLKDPVLTALDKNTTLLKKISQEQDATSAINVRHGDELNKLDKRVVKLEKKAGFVPAVAS